MSIDSHVQTNCSIRVMKNGPYLVTGGVPLYPMTIQCSGDNTPLNWIIGERLDTPQDYTLCRCGQSRSKPFCDGTHAKIGFDGTEASANEPYEKMAQVIDGPELKLKDAVPLCASARFCHRGGDIWDIIHQPGEVAKRNVTQNSADCPSGRLVAAEKSSGKPIEPALEKCIGAIEDPAIGGSGPYWIKGGIPVYSADGRLYEVRNRMTLCRCGKSYNKPFCDSSHYPEEDREVK